MIEIQHNIDRVIKNLNDIFEKQLPYAVSRAMNDTALKCQSTVVGHIKVNFNNRRAWYNKSSRKTGIRVRFSRKNDLRASVYTDAHFATLQEKGGIKRARSGKLAVPTTKAPRALRRSDGVRRLLEKPNTFVNKKGAYRRMGRGGKTLRKIFSFVPQAQVPPRLKFFPICHRITKKHFFRNFQKRLTEAIRTAK